MTTVDQEFVSLLTRLKKLVSEIEDTWRKMDIDTCLTSIDHIPCDSCEEDEDAI